MENLQNEENLTGSSDSVTAELATVSTGNRKRRFKIKFNFDKHFLPVSILISAVLISGSVLHASGKLGFSDGTAPKQIAAPGNVPQQPTGPVDIKITADDHVVGNKDAKVTIVEFADFRCPFCKRFFDQTTPQILKDYVNTGKAKLVYKHYAFLGPQSIWAAEASECAAEQGKFWEFHDWLFTNQAPESDLEYYSKSNLIKYAGKVAGLNISQFTSCLNTDKYVQKVSADLAEGQRVGVKGTPTTFVNGLIVVGAQPYTSFQAIIDGELKKK